MIDDPRYRTNAERVRNAEDCDADHRRFIAARTQAENIAFFEQAEVTIGPIYDIDQILEDPHVIEREMLVDLPDEQNGALPMHNVVPRLSATPGRLRRPAPRSGRAHRRDPGRLGLDRCRARRLAREGVIRLGEAQ